MLNHTASRTLTARSSVPSASRLRELCLCASVPPVTRVLTFVFIGPITFAQHLKSTLHFPIMSALGPKHFQGCPQNTQSGNRGLRVPLFNLIVCFLVPWGLSIMYTHRMRPSEPQCNRSPRVCWIAEFWYLDRLIELDSSPCSRISSSTNIAVLHVWSVSAADLNLQESLKIAHCIYQNS